jgi:hypothetical protein
MATSRLSRYPKKAYFCIYMNQSNSINNTLNSKGAAIFKKMLEDKRAVHEHLKNGGKISDLKNQINFVKPISINGKG